VGSGREAHGKENPREPLCGRSSDRSRVLVRGSSRRITIMRFRPANIRVINRRNSRFDCPPCVASLGAEQETAERKILVDWSFHIRGHLTNWVQLGSKYKPLDAFHRATLLFWYRMQINLTCDVRC